ncbi:MAG: GNAT family N-acetyltransferase [Bacillota bacterium]
MLLTLQHGLATQSYEAWGNGFATEGAKACLKYGFETLEFNKIYSFTSKINLQSENVMKKLV